MSMINFKEQGGGFLFHLIGKKLAFESANVFPIDGSTPVLILYFSISILAYYYCAFCLPPTERPANFFYHVSQ